jgi:hypothetical protein
MKFNGEMLADKLFEREFIVYNLTIFLKVYRPANSKLQVQSLFMLSIRNIQFTKLLKANGRLREFNFRRSAIEGKIFFNVDVTDDRNNRISFRMQKEDSTWKILPQELPLWITTNEKDLGELIENEVQ